MTRANKILAALLGVQIVLAAALWMRPGREGIGQLEAIIPGFDRAAIERVSIFDSPSEGETQAGPAIDLVRAEDGWRLASHFEYPVEESKMEDLFSKLAALKTRGPIATSEARHTQLSVADDAFERRMDLVLNGRTSSLFLGAPAGSRKVAVRLGGSAEVHGASGISSATLRLAPSDWIRTGYFDVPSAEVWAMTLERVGSSLILEREPEAPAGWRLVSPEGTFDDNIDRSAVERLLGAATRIQAAAPADPETSLSSPLAKITLHLRADADEDSEIAIQGEELTVTIAKGSEGHYLVSASNAARPVMVRDWSLRQLVELDESSLLTGSDES